MSKYNKTRYKEKNLINIITEHNKIIFDEQNWVKKDLWKICELTYSYDPESSINTTLFVKGGGLDLEYYKTQNLEKKHKLLKIAYKSIKLLISNKISEIDKIIISNKLKSDNNNNNIEQNLISIFHNSLIEKKDLLNYCILGLPFELEKAGITNNSSNNEQNQVEQEIKKLDEKIFGGDVKNNNYELILAYEYLYEKFKENKENISELEQKNFEKYIKIIKLILPKNYNYSKKTKPDKLSKKYLDIKISKKDYITGFNFLVESFEKLGSVVESDSSLQSISDGPNGVIFPTNDKFKDITFERFFTLSNHEIETHCITNHNSKQLIGNMRGKDSLLKDEGVAMLMEQLFLYGDKLFTKNNNGYTIIDKSKIRINGYLSKTLMGEMLNNEDFLKFLKLSDKIDIDSISPDDRFKRLKRNNNKGVQHKDCSYIRGLMQAIDEINEYIISDGKKGIKPDDLFIGKISFEETKKLVDIKNQYIKDGKILNILKPLFISDAIIYLIDLKLSGYDNKIDNIDFLKYLQNKYPIFDFSIEQISNTSKTTKRNVSGILNLLLKNKAQDDLGKISLDTNILKKRNEEQYYKKIERVKNKMNNKRKNAR